ncbi:MAG: AAA family ATPase, partial [Spirochaetaceae bacterium]|nr:AAA family ATPase [Spirochaetaceae bacterium]
MIEKLEILQYRKLKNITLEFSKNINVISGANGTCKTSLLHLISNAFQAVNKNCK